MGVIRTEIPRKIDPQRLREEGEAERLLVARVRGEPEYFKPLYGPNNQPMPTERVRWLLEFEKQRGWINEDAGKLRTRKYLEAGREAARVFMEEAQREAKLSPRQEKALQELIGNPFDEKTLNNPQLENALIDSFGTPKEALAAIEPLRVMAARFAEEVKFHYPGVDFATDAFSHATRHIALRLDYTKRTCGRRGAEEPQKHKITLH